MSASVPERISNFTCDCCVSREDANFCISIFYIYLLIVLVLAIIQFYYHYQRSKGKANFRVIGSRKN